MYTWASTRINGSGSARSVCPCLYKYGNPKSLILLMDIEVEFR